MLTMKNNTNCIGWITTMFHRTIFFRDFSKKSIYLQQITNERTQLQYIHSKQKYSENRKPNNTFSLLLLYNCR